jgi:hypothetical protein
LFRESPLEGGHRMVAGMWNRLSRTVLAVTAILTGSVGDASAATPVEGRGQERPPQVEFVDMPPEFEVAADWAIGLFDEAALDLPPIRYEFNGDAPGPCADRPGLRHSVEGVDVIEICTSEMSNATQGMILHETAHAWIEHNLTPERKAAFQELRGWTYWRNYEAAAWHENGTEQAAEIMVWGLIDRPLAMVRINQNSCDELDAGYRVLTGRAPLHGYRDAC